MMHDIFDELYVFSRDGTVLHFVRSSLKAEYMTDGDSCTCPAGVHGYMCKHRKMLSQDFRSRIMKPEKALALVKKVGDALEHPPPDGLYFSRPVEDITITVPHEEKLIVGIIEGLTFYLIP